MLLLVSGWDVDGREIGGVEWNVSCDRTAPRSYEECYCVFIGLKNHFSIDWFGGTFIATAPPRRCLPLVEVVLMACPNSWHTVQVSIYVLNALLLGGAILVYSALLDNALH